MMSSIDSFGSVRPAPARRAPARLVTLLALCSAMLFAVLLAMPAPAQAHDTLLSSDPEDGATLEASPEALTFTFSADVLEVSPLVRISDESGTELAEIVPTVDGPIATATLEEPLPAGTHTIQWRVVSSDGHPIEGTQTLTIEQGPAASAAPSDGGGAAEEPGAAASDAGGAESSDAPVTDDAPQEQGASAQSSDDEGGLPMGALIGILAVIAVGASVAVYFIVRRRD
ncbi:copper resistance CopC family protein [Brachybacterium sp. AOP42-C2-15]|uniref:copper resistance CopC family protein n=1 Tax=unclassified Brachybacterium TaxID=2623841 RepID=UPI00402A9E21